MIRQAVLLSERYITDRFLPDKAIDLIDEACSDLNLKDPDISRRLEIRRELDDYEKERTMLLSAEHLSINFGSRQLLTDVNFYLNEGDKVGIIGINGTGKSTFLRVLTGALEPDGGTIARNPNVQVSFLPQNPSMARMKPFSQ